MTTDNVIMFTGEHREHPAQSKEDLVQDITDTRHSQVDWMVDQFTEQFLIESAARGYDLQSKDAVLKSMLFAIESIRSALLHSVSVEHTFQEMAEATMQIIDKATPSEPIPPLIDEEVTKD